MAILDIFKKKKSIRKVPASAKAVTEKQEIKPPKVKKEAVSDAQLKPKKISGQAYRILKKPHVTEKAGNLISQNQYVIEVFKDANKNQIKKAMEDIYGVDVIGVNIINVPRKRRRLGRVQGWSQEYKKAIVRIKTGQKIEVLPR